jgi:hypothetical protein
VRRLHLLLGTLELCRHLREPLGCRPPPRGFSLTVGEVVVPIPPRAPVRRTLILQNLHRPMIIAVIATMMQASVEQGVPVVAVRNHRVVAMLGSSRSC